MDADGLVVHDVFVASGEVAIEKAVGGDYGGAPDMGFCAEFGGVDVDLFCGAGQLFGVPFHFTLYSRKLFESRGRFLTVRRGSYGFICINGIHKPDLLPSVWISQHARKSGWDLSVVFVHKALLKVADTLWTGDILGIRGDPSL